MEIKPIRTEADHEATLEAIGSLWGAEAGTPAGDRLDVLITLAEAWENAHHAIGMPDPIDAIRFRLEQQGLGERELIGVIGSRSRVHEVMHGQRRLTLPMIRRLVAELGLPAEVLIRETVVRPTAAGTESSRRRPARPGSLVRATRARK